MSLGTLVLALVIVVPPVASLTCYEGLRTQDTKWYFYKNKCYGPDFSTAYEKLKLLDQVKGQKEAVEEVKSRLLQYLESYSRSENAGTNLIFHFGGDNGVGKTMMALKISQILSQYQHPNYPGAGEGLLLVSGTSSATNRFAAQEMKRDIVAHIEKCSKHWVLLLDEAGRFDKNSHHLIRSIVRREEVSYEGRKVGLHHGIIILTSDFGSNARTKNMKRKHVKALMESDLRDVFQDSSVPSSMVTIPFVAFRRDEAKELVLAELENLPCKCSKVKWVRFESPKVVDEYVKAHLDEDKGGNARELSKNLEGIASKIAYQLRGGSEKGVVFTWDGELKWYTR